MQDDFRVFGDPNSAIDITSTADWNGVLVLSGTLGSYYTPPIVLKGLARLTKSNPHHGTLPSFKANLLVKYLKPNALVSKKILRRAAVDFNIFGNCYFKLIRNNAGQTISINCLPAINMRRKPNNLYCYLNRDGTITDFLLGEVVHIMEYDAEQQIYGVPYWFGALQPILLSEDARLFFRRFFKNGAHTGLLVATSGLKTDEETLLKKAINGLKGIGSWLSMHVGLPNGKIDDVIKILPLAGDGAKIEYAKLMGVSTDEVMEAWRIPPQLAGMLPDTAANTGDLDKVMRMYHEFEIIPFQDIMCELNNFLPYNSQLEFDNPYQHLSFLKGDQKKDITGYFTKTLGCTDLIPSNEATDNVFILIDSICSEADISETKSIRSNIHDFLKERHPNSIKLEEISAKLNAYLPIEFHNSFIEKANSDEFRISQEFVPNLTALRKFKRLHYKASTWDFSFDKNVLGTPDSQADIVFNSNERSLTINNLPQKLMDELNKVIDET